jgi:hypothetical protein
MFRQIIVGLLIVAAMFAVAGLLGGQIVEQPVPQGAEFYGTFWPF